MSKINEAKINEHNLLGVIQLDSLTMNELPYYQHPYGILPQPISKWIELKIVEPLYGFLELVGQYLENDDF